MWFKARRSSFYPSAAQSIERFILFLQVIMATKEAAERACKEPNPIIDGRKANVNLAILGAKPRINSFQGKQTLWSYFMHEESCSSPEKNHVDESRGRGGLEASFLNI